MSRKHGWFVVLVVVALLAVACGPEMPTTVPTKEAVASPTAAAVAKTPTTAQAEPASHVGQSAASNDLHSLGSADAPVTMIEYSDFQ
jgi:hypothetical protein